jgi:hypothetical protein
MNQIIDLVGALKVIWGIKRPRRNKMVSSILDFGQRHEPEQQGFGTSCEGRDCVFPDQGRDCVLKYFPDELTKPLRHW